MQGRWGAQVRRPASTAEDGADAMRAHRAAALDPDERVAAAAAASFAAGAHYGAAHKAERCELRRDLR